MHRHTRWGLCIALVLSLAACDAPNRLASPETGDVAFAKGGSGKGGGGGGKDGGGGGSSSLVADVIQGDFVPASAAPVLASTCPGPKGAGSYVVDFGHSECLIVSPKWNEASGHEPYSLTDDVKLITGETKVKGTVYITSLKLIGQDVIGEAGISHNTDFQPVGNQLTDKAGFTLHVHADSVPVWRTDSHTGGTRVVIIGWVSIGDIVYRTQ